MVPSTHQRLVEADLLRVVAMISVTTVHSVAWFDASGGAGLVYRLLDAVMRFGVPVFVFLTGYVLVHTTRDRRLDTARFIRRRTIRVALPFVLWAPIYVAVWAAVGEVSVRSPLDVPRLVWHGQVAGHLYFLAVACQFYALHVLLPRSRRASLLLVALTLPLQLTLTGVRAAGWAPPAPFDVTFGYEAQWFFPWWMGYYGLGAAAAWHRAPILRFLGAHRGRVLPTASVVTAMVAAGILLSGATGFDLILHPSVFPLTVAVIIAVASAASTAALPAPRIELWAQRSLGVYLVHPLVLLGVGRIVQNEHVPLSFEGSPALTLPTLLVVVAAVLAASVLLVRWLSYLPGGWALAGRLEARGGRPGWRSSRTAALARRPHDATV